VDLRDYARVLRKRWLPVVVCLLLAVAVAAGLSQRQTPKYESTTQLFVSTSGSQSSASDALDGSLFSEARVKSYADIVGGPLLASAVAKDLGGSLTTKHVQDDISATAVPNTVLLTVNVVDSSPSTAQLIAADIGNRFPTLAQQIEAPTARGTSPIKLSVVKPASTPGGPVSPKTERNLILAFIVGLLLGVGIAILRESLDNTVKLPSDVQALNGRSTLGLIGFDSDAPKHPLILAQDPHSKRAEAFRQLRTNLQYVDVDKEPRSIVITSSLPDEGKSTTACNLAISIAQTGARVLLVEADLRRPKAAEYLGLDGTIGLTTVLVGRVALEHAVQNWGNILDVLPSGAVPPNPSELLGSRNMEELLARMEKAYDIVIIDTPPMLPVTDAAVLATKAAGAIIIVRHGKTKRDHLRRSVEALEAVGGNLLGCVLNRTPRRGPESQNYSGDYYRYGSGRRGKRKAAVSPATGPRVVPGGRGVGGGLSSTNGVATNGVPASNGTPAYGTAHPGYSPEPTSGTRSSTVIPRN
jgi:capsular exopolysaccharide synthesis family protein